MLSTSIEHLAKDIKKYINKIIYEKKKKDRGGGLLDDSH